MRIGLAAALRIFILIGLAAASPAAVITFRGIDAAADLPGVNSTTAAASFDSAASLLGPINVVDFESAPVGNFTNLGIGGGVTLIGSQSIQDSSFCGGAPCGDNTTPAGANFLELFGGSITFSFASPIEAFGAFFGGLQLLNVQLEFDDGAPQIVPIVPSQLLFGGFGFVGFTSAGASISSVTVQARQDIISVDDVRYVTSTDVAVPEPATASLLALALAGLAFVRRQATRG